MTCPGQKHICLGHYLSRTGVYLHCTVCWREIRRLTSPVARKSQIYCGLFYFCAWTTSTQLALFICEVWEFSCDRRSLWHGARAGPTLGNGLFLCICRNEKFYIDRSEFLSTAADSCGNVMIYVTGELVRTPQSKVATFGEDSQVIVSVTWNWTVQRKSVEHTVIALDALLYVNHRQVDGELEPVHSTEALWPGRHMMCGRSQNCCNQFTWLISDEAKATPWFPCESWSKTLGQGYDPSEHFFCARTFTNSYLNVWSCLPSPGKNGKP